jgi:hypothetical protein
MQATQAAFSGFVRNPILSYWFSPDSEFSEFQNFQMLQYSLSFLKQLDTKRQQSRRRRHCKVQVLNHFLLSVLVVHGWQLEIKESQFSVIVTNTKWIRQAIWVTLTTCLQVDFYDWSNSVQVITVTYLGFLIAISHQLPIMIVVKGKLELLSASGRLSA